jgi:hypothetical protein
VSSKALMNRLGRLETMIGDDPHTPTIFVVVSDQGIPDPDKPDEPKDDFSRGAITGFTWGHPLQTLAREAGESVAQLQARARRQLPEVRVFFARYASGWTPENRQHSGDSDQQAPT